MITLTRNNLTLSFSAGTIPAQGSSKVPIQFVNDESTYTGYTIQPNVGWFNGIVNKEAICEFSDNIIYLPAEAFELSGVINVSIALIDPTDGNHIEVTNKATASVNPAPFGTTVLPSEDTWQTVIENFTNQLFDNYTSETVQPVLEEAQQAVSTANEASDNANQAVETANTASENVQTAYSNLGNYKVENGILYFMKADGTYNEQGITLAGQTTVKKDSAVLTELDLNTQRTATPTAVKVQLKDTSGNTFYVETSADNVYLKGTDNSEITQKDLNDKIGQLINLVAFYSANPVSVLTDLKKYITTIS